MKKARHTSAMAKHSAMLDPTLDSGDMYGYEENSFSIPKALSLFFGVVLMAGIFFSGGSNMALSPGLTKAVPGPPALVTASSPAYPAKEKPAAALEAAPEAAEPM